MSDAEVHGAGMSDDLAPEIDDKEALRQSIERNEGELREAFEELTTVVKNEVTLGGQIAERPVGWLLGGLVVGVLLSWRR